MSSQGSWVVPLAWACVAINLLATPTVILGLVWLARREDQPYSWRLALLDGSGPIGLGFAGLAILVDYGAVVLGNALLAIALHLVAAVFLGVCIKWYNDDRNSFRRLREWNDRQGSSP